MTAPETEPEEDADRIRAVDRMADAMLTKLQQAVKV